MADGQKELNPFKKIEEESGPDEYDTLWQAIDLFDPKFPEGLIALLSSSNDGVQMDGLFIFDELGKKAEVVLDTAFEAASKIGSRDSLAYFLSGALSVPSSLRKAHVCYILENATKYDDIIRENSLALITSLSAVQLELSRDSFDKGTIHFIGLNALVSDWKMNFGNFGTISEETLVRLFYERCLLILNTELTGELQRILDLPERDEDRAFLIRLLTRQLAR